MKVTIWRVNSYLRIFKCLRPGLSPLFALEKYSGDPSTLLPSYSAEIR
jgi:hypothetical protein